MNLVSKSGGSGQAGAPPIPASKPPVPLPPAPAIQASPRPTSKASAATPVAAYVLAILGILAGGGGAYLAWETKKQAEEKLQSAIQSADQKIQSTEKDLGELRASHEQTRVALEKKIQEDTGKLRVQLESAESQVQKLEEKSQAVSRELEVISTLKTQQQEMETRLTSVDKSAQETSQRLDATQAGLEDLKKKALKASVTAEGAGTRNPPIGMRIYLTRQPLTTIAKSSGISGEAAELSERWKSLFTSPSGNAQGQKIDNAVARAAVATGTVGQDGAVELQRVPPGEYYLLGATGQGNGFVYEKKITVQQDAENILLKREDSAAN